LEAGQNEAHGDQVPELLKLLDAIVRSDGAMPGISGVLVVGVIEPGGRSWFWTVTMAPGARDARTELGASLPKDGVDLVVCMARDEANQILERGSIPRKSVAFHWGDASLLKRFIARYLRRNTGVAQQLLRFGEVRREASGR